jgi:opacity protein-like surface antigen
MRRVLLLAVWIALSAAGSAAAAPTVVAPLHGGTTIESFGDLQVWSDYNATDESCTLSWTAMV